MSQGSLVSVRIIVQNFSLENLAVSGIEYGIIRYAVLVAVTDAVVTLGHPFPLVDIHIVGTAEPLLLGLGDIRTSQGDADMDQRSASPGRKPPRPSARANSSATVRLSVK